MKKPFWWVLAVHDPTNINKHQKNRIGAIRFRRFIIRDKCFREWEKLKTSDQIVFDPVKLDIAKNVFWSRPTPH